MSGAKLWREAGREVVLWAGCEARNDAIWKGQLPFKITNVLEERVSWNGVM